MVAHLPVQHIGDSVATVMVERTDVVHLQASKTL
jgi:hypothetical protein